MAGTDRSLEFDAIFRATTTFPEPQVRIESVRALTDGGGIATAQTLIAVLERDEIAEIRAAAAVAIQAFGDPSQSRKTPATTLDRLRTALTRGDTYRRSYRPGKSVGRPVGLTR